MSTTTTAYGSITIVDITDIGEFSIYPISNSPLSVVYNPNQSTYSPNWETNPLVLEPMIYYAGKKLDMATTSGLTVTWKRKDGIQKETELTSGEAMDTSGRLTVSANKLAIDGDHKNDSGVLTYICTATYLSPEFPEDGLTATGQITFNLIKHAANVKNCVISGENVFKYNSSNTLINGTKDTSSGGTYHELTATVDSVRFNKWQYKDSEGKWQDYPTTSGYNTSNTETTLRVYAEETTVFTQDVALIRATTQDDNIYDLCTIIKLRDGTPGSSTVNAVLNNDDQWIACDDEGHPLSNPITDAHSTITIYEGGKDDTANWKIECTPTNASGTYDKDTFTYSVTQITDNNANIEFKCTKDGYAAIYKNFSLTKLKAAKDGETPVIYSVSANTLATNRTETGVFNPTSVTFTAHSKQGNETQKDYSGRFVLYANGTKCYESESDESSCSYTFVGDNLKTVTCELYMSGGTKKIDSQTVIVTNDGVTGAPGPQGEDGNDAINVVLGNQADIIPCTSDGKTKSEMTLTIPFTGYLGTQKTDCTVVPTGLPSGMSIKSNTPCEETASGSLEILVAADEDLGNKDSGTITLTFTCEDSTIVHYYQWSKSIQAENAVLFEIYAPNGNIIENGANNVILKCRLMDGSTDKTESATYTWEKYENGTYGAIAGNTTNTLTVMPSDVDGYASYKCTATYGTKPSAYYVVLDKSDPVQAQVYCSLGTQILNSQGIGAVYTKIFRNGEEIDRIKSERFLTGDPSDGKKDDYYYLLDTTNKTVVLRKHNGSAWANAPDTDAPTATYNYTFRDKEGNITNYNNNTTVSQKVFYVDGTLVDKKIVIDVEVLI